MRLGGSRVVASLRPAVLRAAATEQACNHIDRLSVPVIFFRGADDKIVPPTRRTHVLV